MLITVLSPAAIAQDGFDCLEELWMLEENTDRLVRLTINTSNNAIQIVNFIEDAGLLIDAIAFNSQDGFLYGINQAGHELYRIFPSGQIEFVTKLDLNASLSYESMVFDATGNLLYLVGSANQLDRSFDIVNMQDFSVEQSINITGNIYSSDYAVDPFTGLLWGLNKLDGFIFSFDLELLELKAVSAPRSTNAFQGVYFDSFGTLYSFGSSANGIASALFRIDKSSGLESLLATGPQSFIRDFANCPYRADVWLKASPRISFPCNEIEYTCYISNSSSSDLENLKLSTQLDPGFRIIEIKNENISGMFSNSASEILIDNLRLESGIDSFKFKVEVDDIDAGRYQARSEMTGLPERLGFSDLSDNPETVRQSDATFVEIRRIDADSVFIGYFFCQDNPAILDGSAYGTDLEWQNGSSAPTIEVDDSGIYILEALSGCETTYVIFEVTIARCPFNIEVSHLMEPDTSFPCSMIEMQFIIENDTGNDYEKIDFVDTLPKGFIFEEVLKNPYGGNLELIPDEGIVNIRDMRMFDGIDTIIFSIFIDDVDPGTYRNRAVVSNFPTDLGYFRFSDFPYSPELDSTSMTVLGVAADSNYVDAIICPGESLTLDGSEFGFEYLWENGSTENRIEVYEPGIYELQIFSGCEVSYVFYNVEEGDEIAIEFETENLTILLGDSIQLFPEIYSENGIVELEWYDPQDTTVSCIDCLNPYIRPYFDNQYTLHGSNQICTDSVSIDVFVDKTRRIYAANIFTPGSYDGQDVFTLQTSDYAYVEEISIINRWGIEVYRGGKFFIGDPDEYWDGWNGNEAAESGVYLWTARIRFLDGVSEIFTGSLSLLK